MVRTPPIAAIAPASARRGQDKHSTPPGGDCRRFVRHLDSRLIDLSCIEIRQTSRALTRSPNSPSSSHSFHLRVALF